ncbi:MAG: tyrosine-type recombinase/integrase, partial [Alphaproteobacteria bacterium]|nr:tyrosine-type recombinase/integrase [Alphaproteobacteria bacterium]
LYTAQRGQDVIAMTWPHYDGANIDVAQEKTRTRLSIPAHPDLKFLLDNEIPKKAAVIFTTQTGRPWKLDHLRHEIRKLVENCGFDKYSFHGLRKKAAVNLAEAGATLEEIMAVTGHKTAAMVLHYTRGADQKRLAGAAISKLPRKRK